MVSNKKHSIIVVFEGTNSFIWKGACTFFPITPPTSSSNPRTRYLTLLPPLGLQESRCCGFSLTAFQLQLQSTINFSFGVPLSYKIFTRLSTRLTSSLGLYYCITLLLFLIRILFFRRRLNIYIFLPILG